MKLFFMRLRVFALYGGKRRFLNAVKSSLTEATHKRDLVLSLRDELSSQRILNSDVNSVLNETQARLESNIEDLGLVLENES